MNQLTERGRIVVPLRFGGLTRCIAFDRTASDLVSHSYRLGGFVAMQGEGAATEHLVPVNGEVAIHTSRDSTSLDVVALRNAIQSPRVERWSAAAFDLPDELELFLVTSGAQVAILYADQRLVEQGVFAASAARGVPALVEGGSFAYRTKRPSDETDGFESGVFAHGSRAEELADRYVTLLRQWASDFRRRGAARIEDRSDPEGMDPPLGWHEAKRHGWVSVSWS
jgi:protein-L-isoaspartate(D-aspartate) O-methyltransferase